MKKLNKKGFTLIELLAVIVILAIIVVVTVPSIISSINNARLSSLHSLSKEVAEWYDTSLAQDVMALGNEKILDGLDVPDDGKWHCLHDLDGDGDPVDDSLADVYGLSESDINLNGTAPNEYDNFDNDLELFNIGDPNNLDGPDTPGKASITIDDNICSTITIIDDKAVILLVAKEGGKFDTNGSSYTYALSIAPKGYDSVY